MEVVGFTRENTAHDFSLPTEDSYSWLEQNDRTVVAVADGITRDPPNFDFSKYPNPSPAKLTADLVKDKILERLNGVDDVGEQEIYGVLARVNDTDVKALNVKNVGRETDYLENDWRGCVASCGVIEGDKLFYGYIGDCGIALFDNRGELIDKTTDGVRKASKFIDAQGKEWRDPEWRREVRRDYRNRPENPNSYGAITGEAHASMYIKTGKWNLRKGFYVLFYSDGMEGVVLSSSLSEHLAERGIEGLERRCNEIADEMKVKSEGTLVAVAV